MSLQKRLFCSTKEPLLAPKMASFRTPFGLFCNVLIVSRVDGYSKVVVFQSPLSNPFLSQYMRCSDVPWVKVSGQA